MCPKPAGKVTQTKCLLLLIHSVGALDPGGGCGRPGPKAQSWCISVNFCPPACDKNLYRALYNWIRLFPVPKTVWFSHWGQLQPYPRWYIGAKDGPPLPHKHMTEPPVRLSRQVENPRGSSSVRQVPGQTGHLARGKLVLARGPGSPWPDLARRRGLARILRANWFQKKNLV